MKINEANILIISARNFTPQQTNERHWQERWSEHIKTARLLACPNIHAEPAKLFQLWVDQIATVISTSSAPIVLICHSCAVAATCQAIQKLSQDNIEKIKGGFFVSPAIFSFTEQNKISFINNLELSMYPAKKLSFPSFVLASNNDNKLDQKAVRDLSQALGGFFLDAGANGHIDETTGHGPWPEGLMVFSQFMQKL
ncbi:MAG: alpha/beta hydrolase [Alphaproteobacteria bacterium]|nr:alpha/beta hydrolase [Alphaproteobacteria bacterium]